MTRARSTMDGQAQRGEASSRRRRVQPGFLQSKRLFLLPAVLVLGFAPPVLADPIVISPGFGFTMPELTALLGETLVVAILLWRRKFRFLPVLFTWFFITLISYWFFLILGIATILGLSLQANTPALLCALFAIEAIVVLFEAHMIGRMASLEFYRMAEEALPRRSALGVSIVGNVTSIAIGFIGFFG
jgi:hypothetical protein